MADFIACQLEGAMAAWGDIAVGEERPSRQIPTRSALTGLLGAALGIPRVEEQAMQSLQAGVAWAVVVGRGGNFLRDYHTVQTAGRDRKWQPSSRYDELQAGDPKNLHTLVTKREYYTGVEYWVLLQLLPACPYSVDQLLSALQEPQSVLYLGRRSCPLSAPLQPQLIAAESLEEALRQATASKSVQGSHHYPIYFDPIIPSQLKVESRFPVRDVAIRRSQSQFGEALLHQASWHYTSQENT